MLSYVRGAGCRLSVGQIHAVHTHETDVMLDDMRGDVSYISQTNAFGDLSQGARNKTKTTPRLLLFSPRQGGHTRTK